MKNMNINVNISKQSEVPFESSSRSPPGEECVMVENCFYLHLQIVLMHSPCPQLCVLVAFENEFPCSKVLPHFVYLCMQMMWPALIVFRCRDKSRTSHIQYFKGTEEKCIPSYMPRYRHNTPHCVALLSYLFIFVCLYIWRKTISIMQYSWVTL